MTDRTLVLTSTFPQFEEDPRGVFIRQHWENRAAQGSRVRVLAPRTAWTRDDLKTPLELRRFSYAPRRWSQLTGRFGILENVREHAWRALLLPAYAWACRRALRDQIRRFRPDRVVAHMFLPGGAAVASACRRRGIPFEIYGHGTDVDVLLRLPGPLRDALLVRLGGARHVYLPSRDKLDRLRRAFELDRLPAQFRVEPMVHATPVPTGNLEPRDGGILFVGRLIAQKGVDDLLHAAAALGGHRVDIAGDGPERPRLERLASRLGIDATFHGYVGGEEKWSLFRRAGVLCVPSRERHGLSEGAPLVIEEARAVGLPVVAAATGGIPELCAGRADATLVPAGDRAALATAIGRALDEPGLDPLRRAG